MSEEKSRAGESGAPSKKASDASKTEARKQDAIALLKQDHRTVEELFEKYENARSRNEKKKLAEKICKELIVHATIEEEIFYPACREHTEEESELDEAQIEHDSAKMLIADLINGKPSDDYYDAKVKVLSEMIRHHVKEEEKRSEGIFAKAREAGIDADALGEELAARKAELEKEIDENGLEPPEPIAIEAYARESRTGSAQTPPRDEQGRFVSQEDENGGRARRRRRYEDFGDDDYSSGRRGRSDREGIHAGARRNRGDSAYEDEGYYDDYRPRARRRRDEDYDDAGERRHSRDYEDYSSASRYRRQNGERPQGWYGDSEGHAAAARKGWRNRG